MPNYTVESPTGKRITFEWTGPGEPTDADFDQVFAEADTAVSPAPAGINQGIVNINEGLGNAAKGLGQGVQNLGRIFHQGMSMMGLPMGGPSAYPKEPLEGLETPPGDIPATMGRIAPGIAAGFAAPPSLPASLMTGALSGAMNEGTPSGMAYGAGTAGLLHGASAAVPAVGKFAESLPAPMRAVADRVPGALVGAAAGRMMGESWKSALIGAALGSTGKGSAVAKALGFGPAPKTNPMAALKVAAAEARAAQAAAMAEQKAMLAARTGAEETAEGLGAGSFNHDPFDEVDAILTQKGSAPPTRAAASGTAPGEAFPPPPGMGARSGVEGARPLPPKSPASGSGSTPQAAPTEGGGLPPPPGFKASAPTATAPTTSIVPKGETKLPTTGGGRRADLPPQPMEKTGNIVHPADKAQLDKAVDALTNTKLTPQERGALLRKLTGKTSAERGAALSDATNSPLDPDDAKEAADFLKSVGGDLDEALRVIREHPENSVQDVIRLTRAVREASRRAK